MKNSFVGATIIAMVVFFMLNFASGVVLERQTMIGAFLSALWKAPIFALIFHYLHNFIARILGWYKTGEE